MPKTTLGKCSVVLGIPFFIFFVILLAPMMKIIQLVGLAGTPISFLLAEFSFGILLAGLGAFFTGLFAIIKSKERAILVFLTTAIGGLAVLFVISEFLFPH